MTSLARLTLDADGAPDDTPMGICDDCGRVVRRSGRGIALEVPADMPAAAAEAMARLVASLAAAGRCRTCDMF